ncbi:hypothetical protein [Hymenobacter sp. B81]|uniref:hypothetical protein n=1 Tax=Hymenobacter sp. B81 TaxID=3344878 RepID=UPI0037DC407C
MSYRNYLNRAQRADLPLAWRLSAFRSALLSCHWLLQQQQKQSIKRYLPEMVEFYKAYFGIPSPNDPAPQWPPDDSGLVGAIQDLEKRRRHYLQRMQVYQRRRIREKGCGRRLGSRVAWPYGGFLPDEWVLRTHTT